MDNPKAAAGCDVRASFKTTALSALRDLLMNHPTKYHDAAMMPRIPTPDLQEMRNIHLRLKPTPWIDSDWGRGDR